MGKVKQVGNAQNGGFDLKIGAKTVLEDVKLGDSIAVNGTCLTVTEFDATLSEFTGHVDGVGEIVSLNREDDSLWVKVKTSPEILKYIVPKGYITVDGTSLTVVDVLDDESCFTFMLVAYTQQNVVIPLKKVGQKVNLEVDILGKYVERLLNNGFSDSVKLS
ncbi:hypothetical protein KSS87_019825 [Heliosperma pusillum]|nr:hypothetical protein KSS87_019825 [Heliosperma pusillum]